jgi:hypothetical protein
MSQYKQGDVVMITTRQGAFDAVIANKRYITKGRFAGKPEFKLAPLEAIGNGRCYAWNVKGDELFQKPKRKHTKQEIQDALDAMNGTKQKVEERKEARAARGRDAIGDYDWRRGGTKIGIGDEVKVNYRDIGPRWETVAKVNYDTGKVAIAKNLSESQKRDRDFAEQLRAMGLSNRRGPRKVRWLHPDAIKDVRSPERKYTGPMNQDIRDAVKKYGWTLFERFVIANTRDGAIKGPYYDSASHVIWRDEEGEIYWRQAYTR